MAAGVSDKFGFINEAANAVPVHGGVTQPSAPQAAPRQLNASVTPDTGGPATSLIQHFAHAVTSARPGRTMPSVGSGLPGGSGGSAAEGGAAEGAAGAAEGAAGIGAIAEEAAPLLLAA